MKNLANKPTRLQETLIELLRIKEHPCVSIIVRNDNPTTYNEKLRISVKTEIKKALDLLEENKFDKDVIAEFENILTDIEEDIQYENYFNGLGLFVSQKVREIVYFPFDVNPKTIVDDSFEIRDLLMTVNRTFQYDVIILSKKKTRFLNGFGFDLREISHPDIPDGAIDYLESKKYKTFDPGKTESIAMTQYVKDLDHFLRIYSERSTSLIVMGDVKLVSYFKNNTKNPGKIKAIIEGSYDDFRISEIQKLIKEKLQEIISRWEDEILKRVQKDIDTLNYVSGLQEVWTAAAMKEARILLTEREFKVEGWSTNNNLFIRFDKPEDEESDYHQDVVDDIVEMVLLQGGESYFLSPGKLEKFDKILLTLRT